MLSVGVVSRASGTLFAAEPMAAEQYHEPTDELSDKTRTVARIVTSLIEEAEDAVG